MEVLSAFIPMLTEQLVTCIKDMINYMREDTQQTVHLLKFSLTEGQHVLDRVLGYRLHCLRNDKPFVPPKDLTISLIQLLYDAEDVVDQENPHVVCQRNTIEQLRMAVPGLSGNNALIKKLDETLSNWKNVFHYWETNPDIPSMDLSERQCLAYFSLFPIDYQFNTDDLVHLWIGECFVQPYDDEQSLKQIGKGYVMKLRERSILQPLGDSEQLCKFNNNSYYQEFAELFAVETCLHLDQYRSILNENTRHLSLSPDFNPESWSQLTIPILKLRTLLSLYTREDNLGHLKKILSKLEKSLSLLRVLSLRYTTVRDLPPFIHELKLLRYLDISFTKVEQLPTKLHKKYPALQFLKIKESRLSKLPTEEVHQLTNLRYVDWEEEFLRGREVPGHIGNLAHLENLPFFRVGTKDGYFISELRGMNHLQGSICIENLEYVYDKPDNADRETAEKEAIQAAETAMLHKKCGLKRIALHWELDSRRDGACDEHILKGLQPHEEVKELKIENYKGANVPAWISSSAIEKVTLLRCHDCYLPALGKMRNLTTLVLEDMGHITEVRCFSSDDDADTGGCFPQLESIEFHNMPNLVVWRGLEAPNVLPCLTEIKFDGCTSIHHSLPFIINLMESEPTKYISNDGECLRCIGDGSNSSAACPHN